MTHSGLIMPRSLMLLLILLFYYKLWYYYLQYHHLRKTIYVGPVNISFTDIVMLITVILLLLLLLMLLLLLLSRMLLVSLIIHVSMLFSTLPLSLHSLSVEKVSTDTKQVKRASCHQNGDFMKTLLTRTKITKMSSAKANSFIHNLHGHCPNFLIFLFTPLPICQSLFP